MFLTFDGIDGSGKSTQIELLVDWLQTQGRTVTQCRDPGTTDAGESIRAILLGAEFRIDFRAEMLLYMACRAQLVDEVIQPALQRGECVISDRYLLATVVYQGVAGDLDPDDIWNVGRVATQALLPDMTFVLDLDPQVAAERLGDRQDRIESRGIAYFEKVRQGFLDQAKRFPDHHVILDASQPKDALQAEIQAVCERMWQALEQDR